MTGEAAWKLPQSDVLAAGMYPWLKEFQEKPGGGEFASADQIVDKLIFEQVDPQKYEPEYDPYLVEDLVNSIGPLLERCATYRREMYDLQGFAYKQASDYTLFNEQLDALRNLELAEELERIRANDKVGQEKAASEFEGDTSPISKGYMQLALTSSAAAGISEQAEKERKMLILKKWEAAKRYQDALQDRHTTPGHALNYGERFRKMRKYLIQDITVAYDKLRCLDKGLRQVFKAVPELKLPDLPNPHAGDYLGDVVVWLRDVIDRLERGLTSEIEFDHTVSLTQPRRYQNKPLTPLIQWKAWQTAMAPAGTGTIEFSLANEFSAAIKNLRLRGLGLSMSTKDPDHASKRLYRMYVMVFPPDVTNLFSANSFRNRPPVIFDDVALTDPNSNAAIKVTEPIMNIDPRERSWKLQVSSNWFYPDGTSRPRSFEYFYDVRLHMRLRATVDGSPEAWKELSA
ncbi:MAG: hypothetical protein AB7S71_24765 [Dongiaceae bacterium]